MQLVIKNDLSEIETLSRFIDDFATQHQLPTKLAFQINLALEELVTNVISYGYEDPNEHEIRLTLILENGTLRAEMEDDGRAFNPVEAKPPDLDIPLEKRPVGGLGIHLVKNMFDSLDYRRENNRNYLILNKNRVTVGTTSRNASGGMETTTT